MTMKVFLGVWTTVVLSGTLTLAACASAADGGGASPDAEENYVAVVQAVLPNASVEGAVSAGRAACQALDESPDLPTYSQLISAAGEGTDVLKGRVVIDGAVGAFCPDHADLRARFAALVK